MQKVHLEIFSPLPESWGLCQSCEILIDQAGIGDAPSERGLDEYPEDWMEDFSRLASLVYELSDRHGENILIRLVDPRSLQGLIKSIRYRVRRYPTFIINGQTKLVGWETAALKDHLAAEMEAISTHP